MTIEQLKDKAHSLPLAPGVYIMMDVSGEVVYVGKAKQLKNRVSQYFVNLGSHNEKTKAMVAQVDNFDVIVVESEFEALVLEASLIKRHKPHYNILLKDDKGFPFIRLHLREEYPRLTVMNKMGSASDGAKYFGPFGGRGTTFDIVDALLLAFQMPTCRRVFPRDIGKERPCLNYHMKKCSGYCRPETEQSFYLENMRQILRILEGGSKEVAREVQGQMEQAAEDMRFEKAAELRDRLRSLERLAQKQKVVGSLPDSDYVGYYKGAKKACFVVLHYTDGEVAGKDYQMLVGGTDEEEGELLSSLLAQYYIGRSALPRQILLPIELPEQEGLEKILTEEAGRKVELHAPQRGEKRALLMLAQKNAYEEVERQTTREERQSKLMELLGKLLQLPQAPRRLEAFDISNTGDSDIVASMVVFEDAKPRRNSYRRFKLKTLDGADDYAAMYEVLTRRFARYLDGDETFAPLPDVLLIDGGATHAGVAEAVCNECNLSIPVFGMVKDNRHRTRALITADGREIGIQATQVVFALIGTIQEEVHRFAIEYHRQLRSKSVKGSTLDKIEGVGEKRRSDLLKHFKSIKSIKAADLEQLQAVVPKNTAQAVYDFFRQEEQEP